MAQELGFDEEVVVEYDQHRFVFLKAQYIYHSNFIKKKLLLERGISLDKVDELLLNFYQRLITIRGKVVNYRPKVINDIYCLLDHDIKAFTHMDCGPCASLASKLCLGRNVPGTVTKVKILCSDFKVEEIVTKLHQGSGEWSSGPVSYVPQSEYYAYLKDQRKQKAQLANLEKAYASLAKLNGELCISHSKMKKQGTTRNTFFTRMWKGMKGFWKVLKANEPRPTLLLAKDGDGPAT
ncbi:hypothetical protein RDI58_019926 [Solanum bulbocastanum]|uniref:Uncharacterized protein n=1 Tax=Solanum bulbocastanum TaxID=147425 RepID=A0AAN8T7P4_SOLBU